MADIDNDAIEAAFSKGGFPEPTWDFQPWDFGGGLIEWRLRSPCRAPQRSALKGEAQPC